MAVDISNLRAVLPAGRGVAIENIRSAAPKPLKPGHLARIESEILAHATPLDDIPGLMELVRKIAADAGTPRRILNETRIAVRHPAANNPWAGGEDGTMLRDAEQAFSRAEEWISGTDRFPRTPGLAFCRFLVAAILDFRVLHPDYIPAILWSVRDGRDITLHPQIRALPLSLRYGRQENSERRLLILRRRTLKLFHEFRADAGCAAYCDTAAMRWASAADAQDKSHSDQSSAANQATDMQSAQGFSQEPGEFAAQQTEDKTGKDEPAALHQDDGQATSASEPEPKRESSAGSEERVPAGRSNFKKAFANLARQAVGRSTRGVGNPAPGVPDLLDLLEKARILARFHLPSVVAAHRCRQIVSHSLPPEELGRIGGWNLDKFPLARAGHREVQEELIAEPAEMRDDPVWLKELRRALGPAQVDSAILDALVRSSDPAARLMGGFAKFLHNTPVQWKKAKKHPNSQKGCAPATIRRYCLLIATRLIPRLADPAAGMSDDGWEDAIEQLLDEDAFFIQSRYRQEPSSKAQSHSRPLIKAVRHWLRFLRESPESQSRGNHVASPAELSVLEKRLPVLGLVAVDASLITVDEYLLALRRIRGARGATDKNLREAACVALILGYRLGLRRKEAAGLRLSDFDSIEYLHVRANRIRQLKTSNAKRDLPMPLLMPKPELDYIRQRLCQMAEKAKQLKVAPQDTLLFSQAADPQVPIDFDTVIAEIHNAFRGHPQRRWEALDPTFHYHRLRHSFCNLTLLRLWPPLHRVAEKLFQGRHPETMEWIRETGFRETLFGTGRVNESDLQAIALLMGHGSAETSLEHYCHVLDLWENPATWTRSEEGPEEAKVNPQAEQVADQGKDQAADYETEPAAESPRQIPRTRLPAADRRQALLVRKPPSRA